MTTRVSKGEEAFALLLKSYKIAFEREFKFHPSRRWRFDFLIHPKEYKIAIEIEGGVYTQGRHTRGSGFVKDMEKYNSATILGYRVLRYSTQQIGVNIIADIRELMKHDEK